MTLTVLPVEVLEIIFLYVEKDDLLTVCDVTGVEGSDSFWRKVCRKQGYKQIKGKDDSWKTVFQRNINWATQNFVKREYKFKRSKEDISYSTLNVHIKNILHGQNMIMKNHKSEMLVWNIDKTPVQVQELQSQYLQLGGSKLLIHNSSGVTIYSNLNNIYKELITLKFDCSNSFVSDYSLSDEFFAAFENNSTCVKIVNLTNLEDFSLTLSPKTMRPILLKITDSTLNVLLLEGSQYVLKRFDLKNKEWFNHLVLFVGAACIGVPELKISSDLIVSWSKELIRFNVTPIKVWNSCGNLLKSLNFDFITSFGVVPFVDPEQILWMIVEGEYCIFSTSTTRVVIWTSQEPDKCNEIPKDKNFYNGQSIVSSSLLVLSYVHCFKIVDFKEVRYLYEINFENHNPNFGKVNVTEFFANEYFFVIIQECETKCGNNGTRSQENYSLNKDTNRKTKLKLSKTAKESEAVLDKIFIYDFRGDNC